jgi:poly(A) polymerase
MNTLIHTLRAALEHSPWHGKLYLVGGVVRDELLGLPEPDDVDLVLEGDSGAVADFLYKSGLAQHHPVVYPRFGTAMVSVCNRNVEIVTARAESYETSHRKPSIRQSTLHDDAFRRDFTLNTLMRNLHTGELLDLTGRGLEDLRSGVLRTPMDPDITFFDDPLRMMRAVRFASRFGFEIAPQTREAVVRNAERLNLLTPRPVVSAERVRDEFLKMLQHPSSAPLDRPELFLPHNGRYGPAVALQLLSDLGLLSRFAPELLEMRGVTQGAWHCWDVWEHTLRALASASPEASVTVRLGILLHDVAKPRTRTEDERGIHFYQHQFVGAEMTAELLRRLKLPSDDIRTVSELVKLHMRLGEWRPGWTVGAVRRLLRDIDKHFEALFEIARCDHAAMNQSAPLTDLEALRTLLTQLREASGGASPASPLDGREIMQLLPGIKGVEIGRAKEFLTNEVIEGKIVSGDKTNAQAVLQQWWKELQATA